jgi:hypothetical protein
MARPLYKQMFEFKIQFGHCLVPTKYSANRALGRWVAQQRHNYKLQQEGKPSLTTAEHIRALAIDGFDWGTRHTDWSVRFQQLCEYKAQFGHCLVPQQYAANPKLGTWVMTQRRKYRLQKEGKPSPMTAARIRALADIDFDWGTSPTDWSVRFQQLCEYKAQFGHCLVPKKNAANRALGDLVMNQRGNYKLQQERKPSPMTSEQIRALDGIGFDWGTSQTGWSVRFQQLCEYKAQFGNCLVPQHNAANLALGDWVMHQRRNYNLQQEGKPSPMTAARTRALADIGFDWKATKASWNALLEQLTEYKAEFGHCRVPTQYDFNPKLGNWVYNQRRNYKLQQEGKPSPITAERIRALNGVGFD